MTPSPLDETIRRARAHPLEDVIRPGISRDLDFVVLEELRKRTGVRPEEALPFALNEMLCNSLDTDATEIHIDVREEESFHQLTVKDNGSKRLRPDDIHLILDFSNKASSKRGFLRVSRGYLGNALKCIFGYSHALTESQGLTSPGITVESHGLRYRIYLRPNRIEGRIDSEIEMEEIFDTGTTTFIVRFPTLKRDIPLGLLRDLIFATAMVNPQRRISYSLCGVEGSFGEREAFKPLRQETSILWYKDQQSNALFNDYLRARPETPLNEYISLYRDLTSKKKHREILQELSAAGNQDSQDSQVQFLPSTPIVDLPQRMVADLHAGMRRRTRPISKRSVPQVLDIVGGEALEEVRRRNGWLGMRYARQVGFEEAGEARFPYLVEVAVFDRRPDGEGVRVYQCVNFMASRRNRFSGVFDVQYRLGRVNIKKDTPVTVLVHLVCPVLEWLSYGKTSLYGPGLRKQMEKAFDKVLPVPKTPRSYRPPPPPKAISWVPKGKIHNPKYRVRLVEFAREIRVIDAKKSKRMKFSSRGWSYILEGLGKIHKGELDYCQKAINDCRKLGYLPIDFVAQDQDETRRFAGIHEASRPAALLQRIQAEVKEMLEALPAHTTDYWEGEKYYLMMCVEKGDIRNLLKPICDIYHVPIVSSKGWYPILLRAHIARLSMKAEARGLKPVLLLFYDHDPAGLKITEKFRKGLRDIRGGTKWDPSALIIDRFGLNDDDVERYGLTWIENLKTSSGRESRDRGYVLKFGRRKCESNALFKNDETLRAGEEICRKAIEKCYGPDALKRFKEKELQSKSELGEVYEDPVWRNLEMRLDTLIEKLADEEEGGGEFQAYKAEEELEVEVDSRYYGVCPCCLTTFDYSQSDIGKLVRCRVCHAPMRLRARDADSRSIKKGIGLAV